MILLVCQIVKSDHMFLTKKLYVEWYMPKCGEFLLSIINSNLSKWVGVCAGELKKLN